MKSIKAPLVVLVVLYVCFFASLAATAARLPDPVATHFDFDGRPDGWMSRAAHLRCMAAAAIVFPLALVALISLVRLFPTSMINVPNRDFWLAPDRLAETYRFLFVHSLSLAALAVAFMLGLYWLVYQANTRTPVRFSTPLVLWLAGAFLLGTLVWVILLIRHFRLTAQLQAAEREQAAL